MSKLITTLFAGAAVIFAILVASFYRLDIMVFSPMTHHLLLKPSVAELQTRGAEVDFDLTPKFFKEGDSNADVLAKLSQEGYAVRPKKPETTYSRETHFSIGHCGTSIQVKFKIDDTSLQSGLQNILYFIKY